MQSAGDHQMQHEPEIAIESEGDSLTDSTQLSHSAPLRVFHWSQHRAQQKWTGETNLLQRLADDS